MVVFVHIFMLHAFYIKWIVCDNGVCIEGNSNKIEVCCAGYRKINGKCTECVGFFGKNCEIQCPNGFFGKLCEETCNCTESETCNQYVGCMETKSKITIKEVQTYSTTAQTERDNKEACLLIVPASTALSILSFVMCFMICLYRIRRQGKYKVDKEMKLMPVPDGKPLNVQLIGYTSNTREYRQYYDIDITKHACNRNFEKHVTHDYSRLIFPKFTSVDIPGDQYSTAIIRNPHLPVDEENRNSTSTSDRGDTQECLRRPSADQRSARNSRPYSLVHPKGFVEV